MSKKSTCSLLFSFFRSKAFWKGFFFIPNFFVAPYASVSRRRPDEGFKDDDKRFREDWEQIMADFYKVETKVKAEIEKKT